MRKLFLSSAGITLNTKEEFINLLGNDPTKITVGFIPTGADPEEDKSFVQWSIDQIEDIGMKRVNIDLKAENKESLYDKLSKVDVIWVNGGNAFYLLDQARKSGFDEIIPKLLDDGKIYVGVSAGSYLACPNIEPAKWKHISDPDVVGLKDLSAFNLVKFFIVVHFNNKYEQDVLNGAKTTKYPVVALRDNQAVLVKGTTVRIIGNKEKIMVLNNSEHLIQ